MTGPVLDARDLVATRGETRILDGVSLGVQANEAVLVRGESGAGKTTLFEHLGLLDTPEAGVLRLAGENTTGLGERARARLRRETLGLVFQEFHLVEDRTAWGNAALPQDHAGDRDTDWLEHLFAELAISDQRDQYPATLSGGEKQRVAIARALANKPRVILADEPTGQLDPDTTTQVLELLFDAQAMSDAALVLISHQLTETERFDRIRRLADGTLEPTAETPGAEHDG